MPERAPYRRRWRVTFARGGIALALAVVVAAALVILGDIAAGYELSTSTVTNTLVFTGLFVFVPAVWLIPLGALADHFLSRWGFTLVTVIHIIGAVVAFFVTLVALTLLAIATGQPLGGPLAFIFVVLVPPWMVVGSLVAWLVPGSFPKGRGLVMDSARWLKRKLTTSQTPTLGHPAPEHQGILEPPSASNH